MPSGSGCCSLCETAADRVAMPQPKLADFLAQRGIKTSPKKKQYHEVHQARPKQARIGDMAGVLRLPQMSGHAREAELRRLLTELDEGSNGQALVQAMKQLACYELTVDQLEAVPLGKRVRQLRQHSSPDVQQQAVRLLAKMRQDVKSACARSAKAKPIVAKLGVKKTVAL